MSMQIRFEAWLLLLSLLVGCWLMLVYDLLRVLRLMIKHSSFVMGIEDFFYWIYAGTATFISFSIGWREPAHPSGYSDW